MKIKRRIQLKNLQVREKELELKLKYAPRRYEKIIDFPCRFGGRVVLEMEEGYTREDLTKACNLLLKMIKTQCTIYRKLTPEEVAML